MNQAPPPEAYPGGGMPQSQAAPRRVAVKGPATRPLVAFTLLGLCSFIYLLQLGSDYLLNIDLPMALGIKSNQLILRGQLWRLITPMFLHGSLMHILFNMYALYNFGPALEQYYGHLRFLGLFLLGGFAGNVASFLMTQANSLGSSTAIFGLFGAEAVFLYQNRALFGNTARRALSQIVTIGVINLVIGLSSPGIDNWGHLGGLVGGVLFAWFAGAVFEVKGFFPTLTLEDKREPRQVWLAGLLVLALFSGLAGVKIFLGN